MSHKRKAEDDPVIDSSPDEKDQVASESKELTIPNDEEGSVGGDDDVGINDIEDNSSSQSADSDSDVSIDCSAAQAFVLEWLEDKRESGELPFNILKTLGIDTVRYCAVFRAFLHQTRHYLVVRPAPRKRNGALQQGY